MKMHIPLNVPNILSFYRLLSFPVVLYLALTGRENWFVLLFCVNLVTDILDGLIARVFHLETEFGAKLDSMADTGTFILAVAGIWLFKWPDFEPHVVSFSLLIGLFVFSHLLTVIKFGHLPSLHLYSWKIGGYIQGIFFFVLFVFGFNTAFYYFMAIWGILSFTEHILIQLLLPELKSNMKGLYWVLRDRSRNKTP